MTRLIFITASLLLFVGVQSRVVDEAFPQDHVPDDSTIPTSLAWLFGLKDMKNLVNDERTVCRTKECELMGKVISESIDKSVDPCEDFYQFACGKWPEHHPIPKGYSAWNTVAIMAERVGKELEEIASEKIQPDDVIPVKIAKQLYRTCMDTDTIEKIGLQPWLMTTARANGWPMIMEDGEWQNHTTWQKVDDYYTLLTGEGTFYTLDVDINQETGLIYAKLSMPKATQGTKLLLEEEREEAIHIGKKIHDVNGKSGENKAKKHKTHRSHKHKKASGKHRITRDVTEILEDTEVSEEEPPRKRYADFVTKVAMVMAEERGFPVTPEQIADDVEDLIEFQTKLFKIVSANEDGEPEEMILREFQNYYDSLVIDKPDKSNAQIKWGAKLFLLFREANKKINLDFKILFPPKNYFKQLADLLDETSTRTIINHIHWTFFSKTSILVSEEIRKLFTEIQGFEFNGSQTARKNACLLKTKKLNVLGYEFVKRYINEDVVKSAERLVLSIQKEVVKQIEEADWMDETTKKFAVDKAKLMKRAIGYPEWYKDPKKVNSRLSGYVVGPSYFENMLGYTKLDKVGSLNSIGQTLANADEILNPIEVNAFYFALLNVMVVTAADLRSPIYNPDRPSLLNYGFFGFLLGHEVNHGYDNKGHVYDQNGRMTEWLSTMAREYSKRSECFVDQFNDYANKMPPKETIQGYGSQTVDENIADTMGLQAVYRAFKNTEKENGKPDAVLPGLEEYTNDQLLFISFANMWCEATNMTFVERGGSDEHSTPPLRIIGSVSNSEDFAKAFNCPVGSPMNPNKKCNIWK